MQFTPEMADAILAGRKTRITLPKRIMGDGMTHWYETECPLAVGKDYAVCPGRGKQVARIKIVAVYEAADINTLDTPAFEGSLAYDHAEREGFACAAQFREKWFSLYDQDNPRRWCPVWVIDFALVPPGEGVRP